MQRADARQETAGLGIVTTRHRNAEQRADRKPFPANHRRW
jgi:hypothetical protein